MNEIELLTEKVNRLENIISQLVYSDRYVLGKIVQLEDGKNILIGANKGTIIGTSTSAKIGFYNKAPAVQQTSGANLTNNVTAGGTNDTIANFTDLTTYSNDAATIRNDIYQLARQLKQVNDALRTYGLLS